MRANELLRGYLVDSRDRMVDTVEVRWNLNTLSRLLGGGPLSLCRVYLGHTPYRLICRADMWENENPISTVRPDGSTLTTDSVLFFAIDAIGYEKSLSDVDVRFLSDCTHIGTYQDSKKKWYNTYVVKGVTEEPSWDIFEVSD